DDKVPVEKPLESFRLEEPDPEALITFLEAQSFKSLLARVRTELASAGHLVDHPAATVTPAAPERAYALVQDEAALAAWIAAAGLQGTVAVGTVTTAPDPLRSGLVGISLGLAEPVAGACACYIPLGHVAPRAQGTLDLAGDSPAP